MFKSVIKSEKSGGLASKLTVIKSGQPNVEKSRIKEGAEMTKEKKLGILGQFMLLCATLVWGSSFVVLKQTIETVPTYFVLAFRFLLSAVFLFLIFIKKMIKIPKKTLLKGIALGGILSLAYLTQTIGLIYTTPGKNAFLTSVYCVLCPFMLWIMFGKKPKIVNVVAAVLCVVGVGFVALSGKSENSVSFLGEGLTLVCAIFYGFQIIFIDRFGKDGCDSIHLLVTELATVGVFFSILTLVFELPTGVSYALDGDKLVKMIYLCFACTALAQLLQIFGQKFTTSAQASIILCLESVFGTVFSVAMGQESLTVYLWIGFAVIFIGVLLSELQPDFKKLRLTEGKTEDSDAQKAENSEKPEIKEETERRETENANKQENTVV